ncbi:MAG: MBL fold metallo-hydrolase [Gammaproteobacteria bacterium]|nr:MBL fold metallo-hydrolase [Gammaproteobacteria bacterium]MBU2225554.1 MBL fold metallo-hydrolase [Gammaproteobacteria bacterium]MBU2278196.1 MBL fold metallo-hydrolase [Gammaproteobacteria bacterium]
MNSVKNTFKVSCYYAWMLSCVVSFSLSLKLQAHPWPAQSLPVEAVYSLQQLQQVMQKPAQFRLHLIDIGTGLAILVEGADFRLLFDAGSADDKKTNNKLGSKSRLVAYLNGALGRFNQPHCRSLGDLDVTAYAKAPVLDYVFLSHPHEDHLSQLLPVLQCFDVKTMWEPGIVNKTEGYQKFRTFLQANPHILYHTAVAQPCPRRLQSSGHCASLFSAGQEIQLGHQASAKVLHVGTRPSHDPNLYSVVLKLQLGTTTVLLTGDAESGGRAQWHNAPGATEKYLLDNFAADVQADILQVGHHGSVTSSRKAFLQAVQPKIALVSAGPKKYGSVVLPDQAVLDALSDLGTAIYRTDLHDQKVCPVADKIGANDPGNPGGCDNYIIRIPLPAG